MKNIIVLIDNSVNSEHLALSALNIALKIGANITLAHAAKKDGSNDVSMAMGMDQLNEKHSLEAISEKIEKEIANLCIKGSQTLVSCLMHDGSIVDLLEEYTNDGAVALVIIGTHKSGQWEQVMFRTKMQDILENIGCPLMVIPKKFILRDINQTIFAVNLSIGYKSALRDVMSFVAPFNSSVIVNNITNLGFPEKPSEKDLCSSVNLDLDANLPPVGFHSIRSANVRTTLLQTMETGKIDLLCLVHKNYNFLSGLFHRSISRQLADKASIPIMVLQEAY